MLAAASTWETQSIERLAIPSLKVHPSTVLYKICTESDRSLTAPMEQEEESSLMEQPQLAFQHVSRWQQASTKILYDESAKP